MRVLFRRLQRRIAVFRAHRQSRRLLRRITAPDALLRCVLASNRHGLYCVPITAMDRPAGRLVAAGDVYEPDTIDVITRHCGTGDVIHAGTYFGDLVPALSKGLATGATLWAFEPNRESFRCASITIALNGLTNVSLTHAGLGAICGMASIRMQDQTGRDLGGCSRIVPDDSQLPGCERVTVTTVDATVGAERAVSVLQLDVEGHEREALEGALKTIARCRPLLILELQPGTRLLESTWFADHILALGYHQTRTVHGNVVLECR